MPTHKALVIGVGNPLLRIGDKFDYDGPPSWRFEPLDPAERKVWEHETADPARVAQALERTPLYLTKGG